MKEKVLIVEDQFVEATYLCSMLERAGYVVCGIARSVQKAKELAEKEKPDFVLLDIFLSGKGTGIDLAHVLKENNIPFIYLSANSNQEILSAAKITEPYGFLVKPFREKDLLVTLEIARYRHAHSQEVKAKKEKELLKALTELACGLKSADQRLPAFGKIIQAHLPFDFLGFELVIPGKLSGNRYLLRTGFDEYRLITSRELTTISGLRLTELLELASQKETYSLPTILNNEDHVSSVKTQSLERLFNKSFKLQARFVFPLILPGGIGAMLSLCSQRADTYTTDHIALCTRISKELSDVMESVLINTGLPEVAGLSIAATGKDQGSNDATARNVNFNGIIGNSHLLLNVFDNMMQVSPTNTSVLILGETGTGKERIAEHIHKLSSRKGSPFIKLNCAALPATLIESELFGHERGSFTGATDKRIGKFELAHRGTIFLDEIGEMPLELQVKLLRVLQEREIERIGSNQTLKIDVRIIAATNRNLEKEVADGRFRLDLYYRLNIFPISLPALRERMEDLPLLVQHFIDHFNRKAGKKITGLSEKAQKMMNIYHWPGNIRELENFIERSVLLAKGSIIDTMPGTHQHHTIKTSPGENPVTKTIQDNEREHIKTILKACHGRIWGQGGAAEILNLPPSTLKSRMKKLGIRKEYVE